MVRAAISVGAIVPVATLAIGGVATAQEPQPVEATEPPTEVAAPVPAPAPLLVATDPELPPVGPPPPDPPPPPPAPWMEDGAGPRISFGRTFTTRVPDGFYGRFETEYFERRGDADGGAESIGGVLLGLEGWGAPDGGGGGGLPMLGYGGFVAPFDQPRGAALFGTIGLGWSWAIYDKVYDNGGFGIFAPLAGAHLGLDFGGVRLLGEARATYRWQWGAPDRGQGQLGASLSINTDD